MIAVIAGVGLQAVWTDLCAIDALDAVVVEVQMLQVPVEERNRSELVVGQLQVQQGGYVEHSLGKSFITQLVVVQPHKCQVGESIKVVLWYVIYAVLVQEKLYEATRYASWHLFQDVVGQIKLHEALQVLKCVLSHATVTQLVVVQVKQSQVSHVSERACRDLRNAIPTEAELFKACRETSRDLFQAVTLYIEVEQCWDLLKHIFVYSMNAVIRQVDPADLRGVDERLCCHF